MCVLLRVNCELRMCACVCVLATSTSGHDNIVPSTYSCVCLSVYALFLFQAGIEEAIKSGDTAVHTYIHY